MLQVLFRDATFCKLTPGTSVPALYGNLKKILLLNVDVYEIRVCSWH